MVDEEQRRLCLSPSLCYWTSLSARFGCVETVLIRIGLWHPRQRLPRGQQREWEAWKGEREWKRRPRGPLLLKCQNGKLCLTSRSSQRPTRSTRTGADAPITSRMSSIWHAPPSSLLPLRSSGIASGLPRGIYTTLLPLLPLLLFCSCSCSSLSTPLCSP